MKEFIFPEMVRGDQICAVYKMIFDCGSYYIGSALNLRQRMNGWKFKLSAGVDKNFKVTEAFKNTTKVIFEIMEIIEDPIMRRFREDGYIKIYFGKPGCLNIAPSAFTNTGIKQNPNKKINKSHYKPVVKINDAGEIVERYDSVKDANVKNGTMSVSDCFKNSYRKVKGMMFRELDKDGNIIPAPIVPLKERKPRKKGYKISEDAKKSRKEKYILRLQSPNYVPPRKPAHSKRVIKEDASGNVIDIFDSIIEAAHAAGSKDRKNFSKIVTRKRSSTGFYKGFYWRLSKE